MRKLLLAAALLFPVAAAADDRPLCGHVDAFRETLSQNYGERLVATADFGPPSEGAKMEIYASKAGSWTILLVSPSGRACLGSIGLGFRLAGRSA
jgi:hypothetical protein